MCKFEGSNIIYPELGTLSDMLNLEFTSNNLKFEIQNLASSASYVKFEATLYEKWHVNFDIFFGIKHTLIIVVGFDHMDLTSLLEML